MKTFILMIQFLTRIPIPIEIDVKEDSFIKGVAYYPIVGAVIGGINLGVYLLFQWLMPGSIPLMMVLLSNTMVTGAFHLDGIADTCDAIFSARKRERMLEIMKDSCVGTNGALALIFDLALRYLLLTELDHQLRLYAIMLAPIGAKTVVGLLIGISKYARKEGLAGLYLGKDKKLPSLLCILIGSVIFVCLLKVQGLLLMGSLVLCGLFFKRRMDKILGGMTGDTFGAANEIIEIVCLIVLNSALINWI